MSVNPKAKPFYNTTIMYFTIVTLIAFAGMYFYENSKKNKLKIN
jgi:hypothetical protein